MHEGTQMEKGKSPIWPDDFEGNDLISGKRYRFPKIKCCQYFLHSSYGGNTKSKGSIFTVS